MEAEAGLALRNSDQVECADLHKCPLCRAHRQAEWLLFLDFNGGGVVAGWAGCASCYNQQQLRHSGFLQTFRQFCQLELAICAFPLHLISTFAGYQ